MGEVKFSFFGLWVLLASTLLVDGAKLIGTQNSEQAMSKPDEMKSAKTTAMLWQEVQQCLLPLSQAAELQPNHRPKMPNLADYKDLKAEAESIQNFLGFPSPAADKDLDRKKVDLKFQEMNKDDFTEEARNRRSMLEGMEGKQKRSYYGNTQNTFEPMTHQLLKPLHFQTLVLCFDNCKNDETSLRPSLERAFKNSLVHLQTSGGGLTRACNPLTFYSSLGWMGSDLCIKPTKLRKDLERTGDYVKALLEAPIKRAEIQQSTAGCRYGSRLLHRRFIETCNNILNMLDFDPQVEGIQEGMVSPLCSVQEQEQEPEDDSGSRETYGIQNRAGNVLDSSAAIKSKKGYLDFIALKPKTELTSVTTTTTTRRPPPPPPIVSKLGFGQ